MRIVTSIIILLSYSFACAIDFSPVRDFQKALIDEEITGSNVAMVFQDGRAVYHHTQNSGKPGDKDITTPTVFRIFSMSKPITIVAMMTLYEKGLVDFDDPVSKYIPEFADLKCKGEEGIYDCLNEMKIVHLMTHRSGYDYPSHPSHKGTTSSIRYDNLAEWIEDVAQIPLNFEPGAQYQYGINQAILGRVIEVISEKTFYEYLKEAIFDPLNMYNTKFYVTDSERSNLFQPVFINQGNLKGYRDNHAPFSYHEDGTAHFGGEGLVSTFTDYSRFCRMLLNGGSLDGKTILSRKSIDLMTEKHSEGYPIEEHANTEHLGFYYGFSLFVLEDPYADGVNASKGIFGWSGAENTHFWIDPEKNLFGLFMTQARDFSWDIQKRFRKAVYSSVE